jgi:hypothetical protein
MKFQWPAKFLTAMPHIVGGCPKTRLASQKFVVKNMKLRRHRVGGGSSEK